MFVLAIDAGTEAIKAGLFDLSGHLLCSGSRKYNTYFPRPGAAEQDPNEWWAGLVGVVTDCLKASSIPVDQIKGICADATTCTVIPMKANGGTTPACAFMDGCSGNRAGCAHCTNWEMMLCVTAWQV